MIFIKKNLILLVTLLIIGEFYPLKANPTPEQKGPRHIASGSLASDEILLKLLTNQNDRKKIVAISPLADNPEYSNVVNEAKTIKHRLGTELESILALRPDLIILASFNRPEFIQKIKQSGIKVHILNQFNSIQDIKNNILQIGKLIGKTAEARDLAATLSVQTKYLLHRKKPLKAIGWLPGNLTIGENTIFNDILKVLGVQNSVAKLKLSGWPKLSIEKLITLDPDYIITFGSEQNKSKIIETLSSTPGWKHLRAVKNKKIIVIPQKDLSSTSHHVLNAITLLNKKLKELK